MEHVEVDEGRCACLSTVVDSDEQPHKDDDVYVRLLRKIVSSLLDRCARGTKFGDR